MKDQRESGYPFNLPNYIPVFDQGEFCKRELHLKSPSWRSEKYAEKGNSHVDVFEFDKGQGSRVQCNDRNLKDRLDNAHQPQLRIILLQPTEQDRIAEKLLENNSKARELLLESQLTEAKDEQRSSRRKADEKFGPVFVPSQLDISFEALTNVLERYCIAPAACSHVRGQEQVYGSRLTKDKAGNRESLGMARTNVRDPNG